MTRRQRDRQAQTDRQDGGADKDKITMEEIYTDRQTHRKDIYRKIDRHTDTGIKYRLEDE